MVVKGGVVEGEVREGGGIQIRSLLEGRGYSGPLLGEIYTKVCRFL